MPLALGAAACFETPVGSRWCFLEARNDGALPVENPTALVTLVGQDGQALITQVAYSPLNLIRPGEAVPLAALFPAGVGLVLGAVVQLLTASSAPDVEARYLPVSLTRTAVEGAGARRTVRGEVMLEGTRAARRVKVVLVLYNAPGQVVGLREWTAPGALQPGQSLAFELEASALSGEVARFQLLVEAQP
jgi:hypothetical protein